MRRHARGAGTAAEEGRVFDFKFEIALIAFSSLPCGCMHRRSEGHRSQEGHRR